MTETSDADDAWCPPTLTPDGVWRTLLAWWTIDIANHRTRSWTASSAWMSMPESAATTREIFLASNLEI